MELFKAIPMSKELIASLNDNRNEREVALVAFTEASKMLAFYDKNLWRLIHNAHPELDNYNLELDFDTLTIHAESEK